MKLASKIRLKKLEIQLNCSKKRRPLSISYTSKEGILYIKHISCGIKEFFSWSGVMVLLPDNGRRAFEEFFLTSEYARKQPQVFKILKEITENKNLDLAIDIPCPKSDFDED